MQGGRTGAAGDIFVVPEKTKNELLTVAHMVNLVTAEIAINADKVAPELAREWAHFRREWQAFAKNKDNWRERMWYANFQKASEYRQRIEEFRRRLARSIGRMVAWPTGPRGAKPLPGKREADKKKEGVNWKWVLYVGIGIVGVYAVSEVMSSSKDLHKEVRQPMNGNDALRKAIEEATE